MIGNVPYQSSTGTTALLTNGASGTLLTSGGVGAIPSWSNLADLTITTSVLQLSSGTTYNGSTARSLAVKTPLIQSVWKPVPRVNVVAGANTTALVLNGVGINGMPSVTGSSTSILLPQTGYYQLNASLTIAQSAFVAAGINSVYIVPVQGGVAIDSPGFQTPRSDYGAFPQSAYYQCQFSYIMSVTAVNGTNNSLSFNFVKDINTGPTDIDGFYVSINKISD